MAGRAICNKIHGHRLPPLPTIQEIIKIYGLSARKKLSQNFILDLNLTNKIVRSAGNLAHAVVVEVGPGPGGITRSILNSAAKEVIVIEKDGRFLPSLEILSEASHHRLKVVHGDILDFNLQTVLPQEYSKDWNSESPNIHIIGNLPFSVSTPLIIKWLDRISAKSQAWAYGRVPLTLTFQNEVAERMIAPPKSEYRCRLSFMCQYLCDVKLKFSIPGKAFVPPPKVDVGVVHLVPKKEPIVTQCFSLVERVNRHLFHFPNKLIQKPLGTLFPLHRQDLTHELIERANLKLNQRPFELGNEEIGSLCTAYSQLMEENPEFVNYNFRSPAEAKNRRRAHSVTPVLEEQIVNGFYKFDDTNEQDMSHQINKNYFN